jgi:predicted nucleic acid-binding protein
MRVVADASVAVKWALSEKTREPHVERARDLLREVEAGRIVLLQPPHWIAEVAAVLTRTEPDLVEEVIELLDAMEVQTITDKAVYKRASRIAQQLGKHLFDSLYHAVALEYEAVLVSADAKYYRKAQRLGSLIPLAIWKGSEAVLKGRER